MSKVMKNLMKEVSEVLIETELQKLLKLDVNQIVYQSLSLEEINVLTRKINVLPSEDRTILLLSSCFNHTISEINNVLEIENAKGKLLYIRKILSSAMELDALWIDDDSMYKACKLTLEKSMVEYGNIIITSKHSYSKAFRVKLKDIKSAQNPYAVYKTVAKRVAIFILISILGFSTVLAINLEAREKFFHWIVETFPQFSIFTLPQVDGGGKPGDLEINYVPNEFELTDMDDLGSVLIYNYLSKDNFLLTIKLFSTTIEHHSYYDTENSDVENFVFKGSEAYTWYADQTTYLIWFQDGVECHISGQLEINEILRIAENISKEK